MVEMVKRFVLHLMSPSALSQRHSFATDHDKTIRALIVRLLKSRCPCAISRFVSFIIIDSFQRRSCRRLAHVSKESSELISPLVTHGNSKCSVGFVSRVVRSIATIFSVQPSPILLRSRHAVRLVDTLPDVACETSTTPRSALSKALRVAGCKFPAIAFTKPSSFSCSTFCNPDTVVSFDSKSAYFLSKQIT